MVGEDSGLSVLALGGKPGIYSARYSGKNATDTANNHLLMQELKGRGNRQAFFTSSIVAISPLDKEFHCEGVINGRIVETYEEEGNSHSWPADWPRFGYDPVFIPEGEKRSFFELGRCIKTAVLIGFWPFKS